MIVDRPCLGAPCFGENARPPGTMSYSMDLTDRGGCMAAQIVETVVEHAKQGGATPEY